MSRSRSEARARPGARLSSGAFAVIEVLVAIAVLTVAALPILYLNLSVVESTRVDRARLICDVLCLNLLEWFGRYENDPWEILTPTSDPRERVGVDVWKRDAALRAVLADRQLETLLSSHSVETTIQMIRDVEPGLHQLTVEVTWVAAAGRGERVSYARLLAKPRR